MTTNNGDQRVLPIQTDAMRRLKALAQGQAQHETSDQTEAPAPSPVDRLRAIATPTPAATPSSALARPTPTAEPMPNPPAAPQARPLTPKYPITEALGRVPQNFHGPEGPAFNVPILTGNYGRVGQGVLSTAGDVTGAFGTAAGNLFLGREPQPRFVRGTVETLANPLNIIPVGAEARAGAGVAEVSGKAIQKAMPTLRELAASEVGAIGKVTGSHVPEDIAAILRKIPAKDRAAQIHALETSPLEAEQKAARIAILKEGQAELPGTPPAEQKPLVGETRPVSVPAEAPPLKAPTPPPAVPLTQPSGVLSQAEWEKLMGPRPTEAAPPGKPPRGAVPPPPSPPSGAVPHGAEANNPIGLRDIQPGLTKQQEIRNVARRLVSKATFGIAQPVEDNPVATAAMTERARVKPVITSVANAIGTKAQALVDKAFTFDKTGGIPALVGVDQTIQGAPTIADVAARLPTFAPRLSPEQMAALASLRDSISPYRRMLESKGLDIGNRTDVMPGGFYLPRGRADMEGADLPLKVRAGTGAGGGKRGFERPAVFPSQAEGIAKGYEYSPLGQALTSYARDAGSRATEAHVANYFKGITDAEGNTLGQTLKAGEAVPRERQLIGLPGLQGYTYLDEIANAANKVLLREGQTGGALSDVLNTANAFNNLYRGVRATLDDSYLGVQGLLGLAGDQKAYARALKVNIQAFGIGGDKVLGRFMVDFDQRAAADGTLSVEGWAKQNLQIGGATSEFQLGQGTGKLAGMMQNLPLVRQANRAFGYVGDTLRLTWANDELKNLMAHGRTLDDLVKSGEAEKIATAVNNATGWAQGKAFGSMGDLTLFAPRFLQSRLETVARGVQGLRPGATLDQRIARDSLLKLIGGATMLTIAANYALGKETDFRPMVNGRRNPLFLRIFYQGNNYSLLGTWDSLAGAIMNVASGHPANALRGMASGLVTDAWDLLGGTDYNRNPTRDTPAHFASWLLQSMVPFSSGQAGQAIGQAAKGVQAGQPSEAVGGAVNAVSQIAGFKSYPSNPLANARTNWGRDLQDYNALPTNAREAIATKTLTRDQYRKTHPDVDAKLFITGQVDTLLTPLAKNTAAKLMRDNQIQVSDVTGLKPQPYEPKERMALRRFFQVVTGQQPTTTQVPPPLQKGTVATPTGRGPLERLKEMAATP